MGLTKYYLEILNLDFDYKFVRNWLKNFWKKIFKKEISESVRRILPSEESEGFFIAKFRKK